MEFPFNISYIHNGERCHLNNKYSLNFIKIILLDNLQLPQLSRYNTKLYQIIDMISLKKAYNLIIICKKYDVVDIHGVHIISMIEKYSNRYYYFTISNIKILKIMYSWSKQYEHVINEEKTDNSSMEQKLLDTTLQKIETFADIIQSYENKFDRQSAEIAELKQQNQQILEMLKKLTGDIN